MSRPRVALFLAAGFPTVDAPEMHRATYEALASMPVDIAGTPRDLSPLLDRGAARVLVLPYGSAFPADAWPAILRFVRGGGLAILGGAPFHQPVRRGAHVAGASEWVHGPRQPTFARELLIGPAEKWDADRARPCRTRTVPDTGWTQAFPEPATTWALTVRLATLKDTPEDDGSAGPRDAILRPLVHVVDESGLPLACPLLEIDRLRGEGAGARWIFAPCDALLPPDLIRAIVERAMEGASELRALPVRAAVDPGETAVVRVTHRRAVPRPGEPLVVRGRVTVTDDEGTEVFAGDVKLAGPSEVRTGLITLNASTPFGPGLHHARVVLPEGRTPRVVTTGFWVRDEALLTSAPRLTASRDWLRRDGAVFPVVGTTYMASDVHRKFLFEPNPHVWDRDFADMRAHGVNFVRTGIWTGWGRAMLDPGAIDESVLTALDAYVLTAAKHGVFVCFTFFAFLPPSFAGANPYLDPRALDGQREILTLFASRYRGVGWIHWDLINEPSYAPAEFLWHTRPIADPHERRAFAAWARARHGDDPSIAAERWRDTSAGEDVFTQPRGEEFGHHVIRENRRPRKVRDFREFTQDAIAGWARQLRDVLHAAGDGALVTLGQDEGGTGDRPAQQLMFDALDYTAVHTWWNTDDLLWDGVVTKVPERASLHQETGLMRLEDVDGDPWRSPEMAALVLERKVAYAFASRGAGVVEWAWNINPYQPIDNEAVIGLFRPDGTAKPELTVMAEAARFFREAASHLDDFDPDPVVMIVPHARLFLGRPGGLDATKVIVRVLAEHFGVVPTALSDLRLSAERIAGAKLIIVPAAEVLDEPAAHALLEATRRGSRLLVTGAIEGDSYGLPAPSLAAMGLTGPARALAFHEESRWSSGGTVRFEGLLTENVRRSLKPGLSAFEDGVWHEPLPLEFAREREPLVRLLGAALEAAGVTSHPSQVPVAARVLTAPAAALIVCVNETAADQIRRVAVDGTPIDVPVRAYGARMALVERGGARLIAATPGEPIRGV